MNNIKIIPLIVKSLGLNLLYGVLLTPCLANTQEMVKQQVQAMHWVTTWAAAPSSLPVSSNLTENKYDNQTLRQIVHTSVGGSKVRIRLSNIHGTAPLRIAAASIAIQEKDSAIVRDSLRSVTFGLNESVFISRGATVLSDPVDLEIPSMANMSISLYLPNASGSVTTHMLALQNNWVSENGNHVYAPHFVNPKSFDSWDYLSAIDVLTDRNVQAVVIVGDSISDGYMSTSDTNNRWPDLLAKRLLEHNRRQNIAVVNSSVTGNRILREESPRLGENLLARLERDVFSLSGISHIVLFAGNNDIGMANNVSNEVVEAEDLISAYRQIITKAHDRAIKVIGVTLTPSQGWRYYSDQGEATRQHINYWMASSGEFDAVIDFNPILADIENPARLKSKFSSDNFHPNDIGYQAMADSIDLSLFYE